MLHGFSFPNYLAELGPKAQSEIYSKSSVDLALRDAFRKMRHFLMTTQGLTEDEAVSLMSVGVDFGVTQVVETRPMSALRMPDILAHGRWRSGDELDAIARGWLAAVREALDDSGRPIAVALPTTPEGVALLVALSSLPSPVILLPPDVRAWRTEPAIPLGTPLVLLPTLAHLAPEAAKLGLTPVVLPEASTRAAGPPIDPFSGAGIVFFTSGSSGSPKPVFFPMTTSLAWVRNLIRSMGLGTGAGVAIEASPAYMQGVTFLLTAILLGAPLGLLDPRDHRLALATLAEPAFGCWRASRPFVEALTSCVLTGPAIAPPVCCRVGPRLARGVRRLSPSVRCAPSSDVFLDRDRNGHARRFPGRPCPA